MSPLLVLTALWGLGAPPEAAFLRQQAERAYRLRRYERALDLFLQLQEVAPSTRNLFDLALCAERSMQPTLAYTYWGRYLRAQDPIAERRTEGIRRRRRLANRLGLWTIRTTPPGADVFVDALEHGRHGTTPATIPLRLGLRQIEVRHPDYLPESRSVRSQPGKQGNLHIVLKRRQGRVQVSVFPEDTKLYLSDRERTRLLRPSETSTVPVGTYTLTASRAGYLAETLIVGVRAGSVEHRRVVLTRRPRPSGRVLINAAIRPAEVWVDGRFRAMAPVTLELEAGPHLIEVRVASQLRWSRSIEVKAGRNQLFTANRTTP